MAQNALIEVRIDDELKQEADELFADLGIDTPTAIRVFLKQAIKRRGLPFEVCQPMPNAETIATMEETETDNINHHPSAKSYTDLDEMMNELLADL